MVFRSEFPDVPDVDLPIHEAVLSPAAGYGDRTALIDGLTGERVSYARLAASVERVAAGLAEAGVRKGDVVALFSPNSIAYPTAYYGASRAGATVTTVSSLSTPGELAGQLGDSDARWLITVSPFLPTARAAADLLAAAGRPLTGTVVLDGAEGVTLDYLALIDPHDFSEAADDFQGEAVLAVAAKVGSTRLIDNVRIIVR